MKYKVKLRKTIIRRMIVELDVEADCQRDAEDQIEAEWMKSTEAMLTRRSITDADWQDENPDRDDWHPIEVVRTTRRPRRKLS